MDALAGWVVLGKWGLGLLAAYGACVAGAKVWERRKRWRRQRARAVRLELTRWLEGRR